jgi:mono/diheme cytochrome c family protein
VGGGTLLGPDLQGVTERRDRDWLRDWISRPDEMLAEGDPIATQLLEEFNNVPMPNSQLSQAEVTSVVAFLETGAAEGLGPAQAVGPSPPEGDPTHGAALFSGATPLQNGGPACMSCHSIAGVGVLGGGTLGPDLTNVHDRYGEAGLVAALEGLPFPTMRGVYAEKPLTDDEAANLFTYFAQTSQQSSEPVSLGFVLIGAGGFLLLLLLSRLIWRNRLAGVRIPLVGR